MSKRQMESQLYLYSVVILLGIVKETSENDFMVYEPSALRLKDILHMIKALMSIISTWYNPRRDILAHYDAKM